MRKINCIVIHCAATKPNQDIGAKEIRKWHMGKPREWSDIGYHRVIRRDGTVEKGRPDAQPGAHVTGYNQASFAICLVGGLDERGNPQANYTQAQWTALAKLVPEVQRAYGIPTENIFGHRDMPSEAGVSLSQIVTGRGFRKVSKACPCFDVRAWVADTLK